MKIGEMDMAIDLAAARAKSQMKLKDEYINDKKVELLKHSRILCDVVPAEMITRINDELIRMIDEAYSKGVIDCLTIIMVSEDELIKEVGDQDDR